MEDPDLNREEQLLSFNMNAAQELFAECLDEVKNKNARDFEHDRGYKRLLELLGTVDDGDDELGVEQAEMTQVPKCPFTQLEIDDPVKNSECGHVYSREGACNYIAHCRQYKRQPK